MIAAARTIHFASSMLLFGGIVWMLAAMPIWRNAGRVTLARERDLVSRVLGWSGRTLAASVVSGVVWLAAAAGVISGEPLAQAMADGAFARVLSETTFGRVWAGRFGLVVVLAALLLGMRRTFGARTRTWMAVALAAVTGVYLATLAWCGHAVASDASSSFRPLALDIVHLLAAGAWLGALPGLVLLLDTEPPLDVSAQLARRFSVLGVVSVCALVVGGLGNAWYLVGDVPALIGTSYGRLLLVKLALFAAMLALAARNRVSVARLTSRGDWNRQAERSLRRNATIEVAIGALIVAIVGVLGVMVPAAHEAPVWPFRYTLSWDAPRQSLAIGAAVIVACVAAAIAGASVLRGVARHGWRDPFGAFAAIAIAATATAAWLVAVPAYPTTYAASPVRYTTEAIARGAKLYAQSCEACHGTNGRGDGPTATSLAIVPSDLAAHAASHRIGEIYWWIAHGIPRTPMPPFAPRLTETEIWDLVQFLHAQSAAAAATALTDRALPWHVAVVAPDFTFELPEPRSESLLSATANPTTLLVFYTLPQSLPYLRALAARTNPLQAIGVRVIAIPVSGSAAPDDVSDSGDTPELIAPTTRPEIVAAYMMYARLETATVATAPKHVDYLIDRQGYIRARWLGIPDSASMRIAAEFDQAELLNRERPRAPPSAGHVHP